MITIATSNVKHRLLAATVFSSLALFGAQTRAQEYVANGSFEAGTATSAAYCYLGGGCGLDSWTGNAPTMHANSGAWGNPSGLPGWSSGNGAQVLGLQNDTFVSQLVNLPGAGLYTLSWVDAGRASYGPEAYTVSFGGTELGSYDTTAGQGWTAHQVTFQASGSGALLFDGVAVSADGTAFIDKVSLTSAVPEPESYAMMLLGLGALGLAGRRRGSRLPATPAA